MPSCGAVAKTPHHEKLMILPAEEQYAALELFRGCMVEHSVVAYADGPARPRAIEFDGEDWLDYIPVRVPDTLVVEQRLPAGAVAVLINPRHTFTDLYLPLDGDRNRSSIYRWPPIDWSDHRREHSTEIRLLPVRAALAI